MGIINRGNAQLRTNGPAKAPPKEAPKPPTRWYEVLMTHASGNLVFKAGGLRGVTKPTEAEKLIERGLISPHPVDISDDAKALPTNPAEIPAPEGDPVRNVLNDAARKTWKPGMELPKPKRARKAAEKAAAVETEDSDNDGETDPVLAALAESEDSKRGKR